VKKNVFQILRQEVNTDYIYYYSVCISTYIFIPTHPVHSRHVVINLVRTHGGNKIPSPLYNHGQKICSLLSPFILFIILFNIVFKMNGPRRRQNFGSQLSYNRIDRILDYFVIFG